MVTPFKRRFRPTMKKFSILVPVLLAMATNAQIDRPNVVLLMADDMGWAQTGYYGYPLMKTPNLDDMARNGPVSYTHLTLPTILLV